MKSFLEITVLLGFTVYSRVSRLSRPEVSHKKSVFKNLEKF